MIRKFGELLAIAMVVGTLVLMAGCGEECREESFGSGTIELCCPDEDQFDSNNPDGCTFKYQGMEFECPDSDCTGFVEWAQLNLNLDKSMSNAEFDAFISNLLDEVRVQGAISYP